MITSRNQQIRVELDALASDHLSRLYKNIRSIPHPNFDLLKEASGGYSVNSPWVTLMIDDKRSLPKVIGYPNMEKFISPGTLAVMDREVRAFSDKFFNSHLNGYYLDALSLDVTLYFTNATQHISWKYLPKTMNVLRGITSMLAPDSTETPGYLICLGGYQGFLSYPQSSYRGNRLGFAPGEFPQLYQLAVFIAKNRQYILRKDASKESLLVRAALIRRGIYPALPGYDLLQRMLVQLLL